MSDAGTTSRPRTVAIIQARMSSSRLPGKVLMPLANQPAILFMCERVARARLLDALCVATSTDPSDDPLADVVAAAGVPVFRGALDDVLDRFVGAAEAHGAEVVVRLTGDCPLIDPAVIDAVVEAMRTSGADYASNTDPPTYPDGLDVEVTTLAALRIAAAEARRSSEREHVTVFIRGDGRFHQCTHRAGVDLSGLRWTVDYPDDQALVAAMVERVTGDPVTADRFDYLRAYDALGGEAPAHARNEGLALSLAGDDITRGG